MPDAEGEQQPEQEQPEQAPEDGADAETPVLDGEGGEGEEGEEEEQPPQGLQPAFSLPFVGEGGEAITTALVPRSPRHPAIPSA